jgi:ADP-ribose pyrophosphatase YjhB (NUDIX family)
MTTINNIKLGVGALIFNHDNKLLLGLRGPKVSENLNKWELLGGEVNFSETLSDAIKRNVREEAGIEIESEFIIGTNDKYENEKNIRWAGFTWKARLVSGTPHVVSGFQRDSEFKWVTVEEAIKMDVTAMTRLQLEQYQNWLKEFSSVENG